MEWRLYRDGRGEKPEVEEEAWDEEQYILLKTLLRGHTLCDMSMAEPSEELAEGEVFVCIVSYFAYDDDQRKVFPEEMQLLVSCITTKCWNMIIDTSQLFAADGLSVGASMSLVAQEAVKQLPELLKKANWVAFVDPAIVKVLEMLHKGANINALARASLWGGSYSETSAVGSLGMIIANLLGAVPRVLEGDAPPATRLDIFTNGIMAADGDVKNWTYLEDGDNKLVSRIKNGTCQRLALLLFLANGDEEQMLKLQTRPDSSAKIAPWTIQEATEFLAGYAGRFDFKGKQPSSVEQGSPITVWYEEGQQNVPYAGTVASISLDHSKFKEPNGLMVDFKGSYVISTQLSTAHTLPPLH